MFASILLNCVWAYKFIALSLKKLKIMCTKPITIFNRSEYLNSTSPLKFVVPCGHCPECRKARRMEFQLLNTAEFEDVKKHGGYSLFETLTFDDKHLPRILGAPVFNRDLCKAYLKNMREWFIDSVIRLDGFKTSTKTRKEYREKTKGLFTYLLVSELGTDTHRPHHHVIFNVKDPRVTWQMLKDASKRLWSYGFVDNQPQKHLVNSSDALGLWSYMTKYVLKDLSRESRERYDNICNLVYAATRNIKSPEFQETLQRRLKSNINPFYMRSQFYGLASLSVDKDEYIKDGFITYKCKDKYYKFSLPSSFVRKYLLEYDSDKKRYNKTEHYKDWLFEDKYRKFVHTKINNSMILDSDSDSVTRYQFFQKYRPFVPQFSEDDILFLDIYSENNTIVNNLYSENDSVRKKARQDANNKLNISYSAIPDSVVSQDSYIEQQTKLLKSRIHEYLTHREKVLQDSAKVLKRYKKSKYN